MNDMNSRRMKKGYVDFGNLVKRSHLFLVVAFLLLIAGGLIFGLTTNNPDRSNWVKSVGRVYGASIVRSKWRKVEHWVGGERYTGFAGIGFDGNCVGDVYEILVNPDDFEEIYLLDHRPLFLKGEVVEETIGSLLNTANITIEGKHKEAFIRFAYTVNGRKYRRVQMVKVPIDSPLTLQKGMQFRVRYWLEDPQRSILDYNEPR